ncbi:cupin domain-containing protein [Arthrobacter sp. UYCu712]|uniref:cupin domain-containing protein n=1 Tax=Arthrobacter sp. UYCu712 TaxID=3156340 RepID=UPI0033907898
MGGTASIIPATIPLFAHNSNSPVSGYLGAVPALFFGLMAGVLLSAILLRQANPEAVLSAGSLLQFAALIAIAVAPDGATFAIAAGAAGMGFGLCEASGSIMARVVAGEKTTGLLSALTGTVALVAALGPLLIVAGIFGVSAVPLLAAIAFVHLTTVALFLFVPKRGPQAARALADPARIRPTALLLLLAPVSAALFVYVGVETIFAGWSAVIPAEALALDATAAAAGTSAFWILMATGRYAAWFILKTTVTQSAVLISTCSIAVACFAVAGVLRQAHPVAALVSTGVAIVCLGPMYSLILGIGLTRVKVEDAKKAVGLLVACGAAGGACIPAVLLSATSHPGAAGVFLTVAALTAAIVPLIVGRRRQLLPPDHTSQHSTEPENRMAVLHDIEESLASKEPTAPPSWTNAHLALVNEKVVLHSGAGVLQGAWHSQDSDEVLLVLSGRCTVETGAGALTAGAGQLIRISAHEPHRVSTGEETVLVAIEGSSALRTPLTGPGA